MILAVLGALLIGLIIGRFFIPDFDDCPRQVMGYNCRGGGCDHSKYELYTAMATMAKQSEDAAEVNHWRGGKE